MAPAQTAPGLFAALQNPGAAHLPRPVSTAKAKTPRRRLESGGDVAAHKCLVRGSAIGARKRARFPQRPATVGGARGYA